MRKTKIIATIGPSCADYKRMKKIVIAGANILRINLSHATREFMEEVLTNVKKLRQELKLPLPIMLDTRGPELRIKTFKTGSVEIEKGQSFIFSANKIEGDNTQVGINIAGVVDHVKVGDIILANNGMMKFKVVDVEDKEIVTKAQTSGILRDRKSLFIPGVDLNVKYLNQADKEDILWGINNNVEFVAISFVNSKNDVNAVRKFIEKNGGSMKIIAKIESQLGIDNMNEIIEASDAVMVARGDLGVEVSMERLPELQKSIIKNAQIIGKPVVTATEMLESMIQNPRPTRAEVSDVANAVYDGTSCVMLSGETASGSYPVEAVQTMANVCVETENHLENSNFLKDEKMGTIPDMISQCAVGASYMNDAKAIVAFTTTGRSAGLISRFRPHVDILGATPNEHIYRQLEIFWGVKPIKVNLYTSIDSMLGIANNLVKKENYAKHGDAVIVTCGTPQVNGGTNLIKIIQVE